jgi:hypothetical protein
MFGSAASAARTNPASIESVGVPQGFGELSRDHEILVDLFFGGRKIGEARVIARPGFLRFKEPAEVLALIPNIIVSSEMSQAFNSEFPTNAGLVCADGVKNGCGEISPASAGVIFDEDHFRVDLFINPKWLNLIRPHQDIYLATPDAPLSLTSSTGLALSGTTGTSPVYNLQNRTIVGFRNGRVRADISYASRLGFVADSLAGEIDTHQMRYSAGLFWAPGLDLIGQRRIIGVGATTQLDTRSDRDTLEGTPLVVFLSQRAQIDILIDGRLVTSGAYEAGNNIIDTSNLPDGSYSLVLRIHEASGAIREERRFFAKNPQIAAVGLPIYFAYAGLLANTVRGHLISTSHNLFYDVGSARRLNDSVALDLSLVGTQKKLLLEAGGWLLTPRFRVRAAALVSVTGDRGALLQVASATTGRLNFNFDLRRVWSRNGDPLIPVSTYVDTFEPVPLDERQIGNGSYTQASGSVGLRLGAAYLSVIGTLRKDSGHPIDYSVGPDLNWPIINKHGFQVAIMADGQLTRSTTAGFAGIRMFYSRSGYSLSSTTGAQGRSSRDASEASKSRAVSDTTVGYSYSNGAGTDLSLEGGVTRELDDTSVHGDGALYGPFGSARAEFVHYIEGSKRTQYGLSVQTGTILSGDKLVVGGRDLSQSAILVAVQGNDAAEFDVLINGQSRGQIRAGERLPVFVQPYRAYSVSLRPLRAASVWFDTGAREFTVYPGNVQQAVWRVEHLLTIYGQAVRKDGKPVSNAVVTSDHGVGESNADGNFLIETSAIDTLSFQTLDGTLCKVPLATMSQQSDYARVGKVVCQ